MAGGNTQNNRSGRQGNQRNTPASSDTTDTQTPSTSDAATDESPEQIPETPAAPAEDAVVMAAPAPAADPVVTEVAVTEVETPEVSALDVSEDDDELVTLLKEQLAGFVKAVSVTGVKPEDFRMAAKLNAQITKFVIMHPKVDVLEAVLAFFKENIDGVCSLTNYLKGLTTLSEVDQQQVGFFYNFFNELARGQVVRIDNGAVLRVLKKIEFTHFHQRKVSMMRQMANQQ